MKKLLLAMVLLPLGLLAQEVPAVPITDVINKIIEIIKQGNTLGKLGIASGIVTVLIMFLNSDLFGKVFSKFSPIWKRFIILVLGQISSILISIIQGSPVNSAIWTGLIISGGAILIFESLVSVLPDTAAKFKDIIAWIVKILALLKKKDPETPVK